MGRKRTKRAIDKEVNEMMNNPIIMSSMHASIDRIEVEANKILVRQRKAKLVNKEK